MLRQAWPVEGGALSEGRGRVLQMAWNTECLRPWSGDNATPRTLISLALVSHFLKETSESNVNDDSKYTVLNISSVTVTGYRQCLI